MNTFSIAECMSVYRYDVLPFTRREQHLDAVVDDCMVPPTLVSFSWAVIALVLAGVSYCAIGILVLHDLGPQTRLHCFVFPRWPQVTLTRLHWRLPVANDAIAQGWRGHVLGDGRCATAWKPKRPVLASQKRSHLSS